MRPPDRLRRSLGARRPGSSRGRLGVRRRDGCRRRFGAGRPHRCRAWLRLRADARPGNRYGLPERVDEHHSPGGWPRRLPSFQTLPYCRRTAWRRYGSPRALGICRHSARLGSIPRRPAPRSAPQTQCLRDRLMRGDEPAPSAHAGVAQNLLLAQHEALATGPGQHDDRGRGLANALERGAEGRIGIHDHEVAAPLRRHDARRRHEGAATTKTSVTDRTSSPPVT